MGITQRFIRVFGRVFMQNTYEAGFKHKLVVGDVVTCTLFCARGYVESRDAATGERKQDNYAGLLLKAEDFVCREYDLLVTEPTVVYCYDELVNNNERVTLTPVDIQTGASEVLPQGTKLFLCEGTLRIGDTLFAGPTGISITTGDKTIVAESHCLGLQLT